MGGRGGYQQHPAQPDGAGAGRGKRKRSPKGGGRGAREGAPPEPHPAPAAARRADPAPPERGPGLDKTHILTHRGRDPRTRSGRDPGATKCRVAFCLIRGNGGGSGRASRAGGEDAKRTQHAWRASFLFAQKRKKRLAPKGLPFT